MVSLSQLIFCIIQVCDAGNLLTRAGFTLPGVDVDEYVVRYNSGEKISEHIVL
jgi:NADH dehydrogenase [ubiquinone] 1 alpha subcomplex assembly factor 5